MRKGIKTTLIVFGASAGAVITYKLVKKIGKFLSELNEELAFEEEGGDGDYSAVCFAGAGGDGEADDSETDGSKNDCGDGCGCNGTGDAAESEIVDVPSAETTE